jgi:phospholipid-translocating ATPase
MANPLIQSLEDISLLISDRNHPAKIHAEPPCLNLQEFTGVLSWKQDEGLNIENILWSSTVVATGDATCCVIYTGSDTRIVMNTNRPRSKVGLVDLEINKLTKVLFVALALLSLLMLILKGFAGPWYTYYVRYLLIFS